MSANFLTGRRVHVDGFVFRDDNGDEHNDVLFVVGPAPHVAGHVTLQDPIDGLLHTAPTDHCHPIA